MSKGHGPLVFADGDLVFFIATIGALLGPASAGKGCELRKGLDTIFSRGERCANVGVAGCVAERISTVSNQVCA